MGSAFRFHAAERAGHLQAANCTPMPRQTIAPLEAWQSRTSNATDNTLPKLPSRHFLLRSANLAHAPESLIHHTVLIITNQFYYLPIIGKNHGYRLFYVHSSNIFGYIPTKLDHLRGYLAEFVILRGRLELSFSSCPAAVRSEQDAWCSVNKETRQPHNDAAAG